VEALDDLTRPPAMFPSAFLPFAANVIQAGTTINRRTSTLWAMAPQSDEERH
jgi:hypothetical protein